MSDAAVHLPSNAGHIHCLTCGARIVIGEARVYCHICGVCINSNLRSVTSETNGIRDPGGNASELGDPEE